jgi:glucoamylase
LDDPKAANYYESQAERLIGILPAFWNDKGYWQSTSHIEVLDAGTEQEDRKWLDCALALSIIHHGSDGLFTPTDSETLASLRTYILSFEGLYPLNKRPEKTIGVKWVEWFRNSGPMSGSADWTEGWAVGRYAEDVYNGIGISRGNPWSAPAPHIITSLR